MLHLQKNVAVVSHFYFFSLLYILSFEFAGRFLFRVLSSYSGDAPTGRQPVRSWHVVELVRARALRALRSL